MDGRVPGHIFRRSSTTGQQKSDFVRPRRRGLSPRRRPCSRGHITETLGAIIFAEQEQAADHASLHGKCARAPTREVRHQSSYFTYASGAGGRATASPSPSHQSSTTDAPRRRVGMPITMTKAKPPGRLRASGRCGDFHSFQAYAHSDAARPHCPHCGE